MLRTNLSTRPFYNERAVHFVLALVAAGVVALTLFNIFQIVNLSRKNTDVSARVERDNSRAQTLTQEAVTIRRGINPADLKTVTEAAREANAIIDRRVFSWTDLFNRIEATLPPDVMLTSVRPHIEKGVISVSIVVVGRRVDDIDQFMEKLESTGAFAEVLSRQEEATDDGMYRAALLARYVPDKVKHG